MKKCIAIAAISALFFAGVGCAGEAVVTTQPAEVVYTQPGSPGAGYVWIDGDWYWSGGTYVWRNGYWARPRQGRTWTKGYWEHRPHGYYWHRGHWQ